MAPIARPVRRRAVADTLLACGPLVLAAAVVAWRLAGDVAAAAVAVAAIGAVIAVAMRRIGRLDGGWLARRLDAARGDMDDSAALLFTDADTLTPLARLQRARLERRLAEAVPDLRPAWSMRRIAAAWLVAAVVIAACIGWPRRESGAALAPAREGTVAVPGVPRLVAQRLRIVPPAYTRVPARDAATLDVRAPQGSRLDWTLRFAPQPAAADLVFADGGRVGLVRTGDLWHARRPLDRSMLYRVVPRGGATPPLHRLDAVADAPPEIKVIAPDRSLSRVTPGQRRWPLDFAATDDYGVAATAQLHLTIAEGEGESVKFRETVIPVAGTGTATARRFRIGPDLAALRFIAGSDLVAQLVVTDNRSPTPQTARSPGLILRWPASEGGIAGMEGVVTRSLPAYFRSERQIIIDAEALLKERPRPTPDRFLARSDGIAADQRLLRLRYGQFLGEEQEGKTPPPPTADAAPADAAPAPPVAEGDGKAAPPRFGGEGDTLEQFGHVHDESEAATLLDPDTRTKLKGALDAMWQAELNLRQAKPAAALPFAYTALGLIKQVQQATRIFLARVGPDLPPIDPTRRLTGKRDGIEHRELPPIALAAGDSTPATLWRALAEPGGPTAAQLIDLDRWARASPAVDPLAVAAAIDAVRRDPACGDCRRSLRGLVWAGLSRPAPGAVRRDGGDAVGRRYLDALREDAR